MPPDDSFRLRWEALADRTGAPPFLRAGWIEAWWRAFGRGRLELAHVERDGALAALLPVHRGRRKIGSPTNWHSPRYGPLRDDRQVGAELVARLLEPRPEMLALGFVADLGSELSELHDAARASGYRTLTRGLERSPVIGLDGGWSEVQGTLSRGLRRDLRRRHRRLAEQGRVWLDMRADTERLSEAFELEQRGWKGRSETAILSSPQTTRFYTEVAHWAAADGRLRLGFLRCGTRAVAFHLALQDGGTYFPLKGGFDPAFAAQAPGHQLIAATLQWACESGLDRYELLGGHEAYKQRWTAHAYDRVLFEAFAPSAAGRAAYLAHAHGRPLARRAVLAARRGWRARGRLRPARS